MAALNGDGFPINANETLYCRNLPDKLQKDDLKRELYMLFGTYGPVLDIVALKTNRMRGQAHILFRDKISSTQALRDLNNQDFFGKAMQISYAKTKSDTLAKLDGTYKQPAPATEVQATETQRSIFAGPPGTQSSAATQSTLGPPPSSNVARTTSPSDAATPASQGIKRSREESEEEDEGAPMDMDDEAMDESDDD
ncbi:RNA recognition motif-containing protein 7 [Elsinoe fawcettii]|nr:RNA recognition motif-containing protein 7 [Elsinoe fawcettii]